MIMLEVCRVRKHIKTEEWDPLEEDEWFIMKIAGTFFWFNSCLDIVQSPFGLKGNINPFASLLNNGVNGVVEWDENTSYEISYFVDGEVPYDRKWDIDYKELLLKLLVERGFIETVEYE